MKLVITLIIIATIPSAYGSSDRQVKANGKEVSITPAVVIDDTPVVPLTIGGSMQVLKVSSRLADPDNYHWRDAQEYRLNLDLAPPVHPSINLRHDAAVAAVPLFLRAASDGEKLYLRMRWVDYSQNAKTTHTEFADAAAIQFPLGDAASTSFMMGAPAEPVNIWYWKAGQAGAQNLAAGGFGSTTTLDTGGLNASSVYRSSGEWVVVFSRSLAQAGEYQVQLGSGPVSVAFALWQGEQKQRDGLKHVSMGWVLLRPPAQG